MEERRAVEVACDGGEARDGGDACCGRAACNGRGEARDGGTWAWIIFWSRLKDLNF